jgi:hypothetical protein
VVVKSHDTASLRVLVRMVEMRVAVPISNNHGERYTAHIEEVRGVKISLHTQVLLVRSQTNKEGCVRNVDIVVVHCKFVPSQYQI